MARYLLFVDEAGDDGLVASRGDQGASSDWFLLGGILVRQNDEPHLVNKMRDATSEAGLPVGRDIHFNRLNEKKRRIFTRSISETQVRWFCVASHKHNMISHKNERAAAVSGKRNALYPFLLRLLLERVTSYCANHDNISGINHAESDLFVRISSRGGLRGRDLTDYAYRMFRQRLSGGAVLNKRQVDFRVFAPKSITLSDNASYVSLQAADVVVSAIYKAISAADPNSKCMIHALDIARRAARSSNGILGEGLMLLPWNWEEILPLQVLRVVRRIEEEAASPRLCDLTGRL